MQNLKNNVNLNDFMKSQLDSNETAKECLQSIGKSLGQYTNFHHMLNSMSDEAIRELDEAICNVKFHRKRFTDWVNCTREKAAEQIEDNEKRTKGYFTYGEFGGEYGYFKHRRKLTDLEKEWLEEYAECCYYNGQPCERWQHENGNCSEDCECVLGREYTSLILNELDIDEEKRLGVWQQDITWTLNGYGGDNPDCYYSLDNLKEDALELCDDPSIHDEIKLYDGKKSWSKGNIKIKVINDNETSESDKEND